MFSAFLILISVLVSLAGCTVCSSAMSQEKFGAGVLTIVLAIILSWLSGYYAQ